MMLGAAVSVNNSNEAIGFYCEAFGMTLGYYSKNPDGTYLHAELEKNGKPIFCIAESTNHEATDKLAEVARATDCPIMNYGIDFDTKEEIEKAYTSLRTQGHVIRPLGPLPWSTLSADVVDKYGVYWYITLPQHRPSYEDMAAFLEQGER